MQTFLGQYLEKSEYLEELASEREWKPDAVDWEKNAAEISASFTCCGRTRNFVGSAEGRFLENSDVGMDDQD